MPVLWSDRRPPGSARCGPRAGIRPVNMLVAVGCDTDRYEEWEGEGAQVCVLFSCWRYCVCSRIVLRWFITMRSKTRERIGGKVRYVGQSGQLAACAACLCKSKQEHNVTTVSTNHGVGMLSCS